jgi:hypothetical protein
MLQFGEALQALLARYREPGQFRLAGSVVAVGDVEGAIRELRAGVNHSFSSRFADL